MPLVHDETSEPDDTGNVTVHPKSGGSVSGAIWAGVKGAGKQLVSDVESIPGVGSIPNEDKKSPVMNWAQSGNPDYPTSDTVGRIAGEIAPLAALPDIEFPALAARGAAALGRGAAPLASKIYQGTQFAPLTGRPIAPWLPSALNRIANLGWKGAVGGASQSPDDRAGGAEVGAGTAIGTRALRNVVAASHVPRGAIPFGLAALIAAWLERDRLHPWLAAHALEAGTAATAAGGAALPSGVAGAIGSRVGRYLGGDSTSKDEQPDDNEEVHVGQ